MITRPQHLACLTVGVCLLGLGELEAQERRWPALYRDTAEVNVVNVDVFVSDAGGRPVRGLGKDDFRLLADGRPVEISNFYAIEDGRSVSAVRTEARPEDPAGAARSQEPEERPLRLIVFVDNENITAADRKRVFQRLREVLLEHRRAEVEVMLVSHEDSAGGRPLTVRQGFTSVPHEIFVALDEIEDLRAGGNRLDVERRNLLRDLDGLDVDLGAGIGDVKGDTSKSLGQAMASVAMEARSLLPRIQAYSDQRFAAVRRTLGAVTRLVDLLAALPGRKSLVYAGDGLPLKPGEALFDSFANRVAGMGSLTSELSPGAEAARYDATHQVLDLVERANAARVTFYALNAAPPARLRRGAAESRVFRATGAAGEERSRHESLVVMAEGTGGRVGLTRSSVDAALRGMMTDRDHYYSLGYVAEAGEDGSRGSLEVELRESGLRSRGLEVRGLQVRHRRGFRVRSSEEQAAGGVLSALLLDLRNGRNPLGVHVGTGDVTRLDDGTFVVPVLLEVPLGNLVLVPGKAEHVARVALYVASRDGQGRISEVIRHLCPIRVPNSELLLAAGRASVCGVRLGMRGGEQEVAVAVRDEVAGLESIVRLEIDVPGGLNPVGGSP